MAQNQHYAAYDIGEWTYGYPRVVSYNDGTQLEVGKFTSIGGGVIILLGGEHHWEWVTMFPFSDFVPGATDFPRNHRSRGDVSIGNDVWIGEDALILSGVTIGDGAVIGARSVVTKDINPYSIAAGVPARHLRYRFDENIVIALQEIKWWDWPMPKIIEHLPLLLSGNTAQFIQQCGYENVTL